MLDIILQILKTEHITTYLIHEETQQAEEVFFIKKSANLKRRKDITNYQITVYYDFPISDDNSDKDKFRGSSTCSVSTAMTEQQVRETILNTYQAATYTKNPYFPILAGTATKQIDTPEQKTLSMDACIHALFLFDTEEDTFINSAELFITTTWHRIINSEGVDVSYHQTTYFGEFVIQSILREDVELYQDFTFTDSNTGIIEAIQQLVKDSLVHAKNRSIAIPVSQEHSFDTIILEGGCLKDFFGYFTKRCDATMIYPGYSNYKTGMQLEFDKTKLDITLLPDAPYTTEGILLEERPLIQANEVKTITGDLRFSHYLGIPASGTYKNFKVACGTNTLTPPKNSLRIVQFSDFQMESLTGQFGGEYRLAYYTDADGITIPVTNGSISGNILALKNTLTLSSEELNYNGYQGPKTICYQTA